MRQGEPVTVQLQLADEGMAHFEGADAVADLGALPELTKKWASVGEFVDQRAQSLVV
jgi:hypothetical protein